jgi:hypothetical protein
MENFCDSGKTQGDDPEKDLITMFGKLEETCEKLIHTFKKNKIEKDLFVLLEQIKQKTGVTNEPFNVQRNNFWFVNLNNVQILRENSIVPNDFKSTVQFYAHKGNRFDQKIYFDMGNGIKHTLQWFDIFGPHCNWKVVKTDGPFAEYAYDRTTGGRYDICGMTHKEKSAFFHYCALKRPDKGELTRVDMINILNRIIRAGKGWIPTFIRTINYLLSDFTTYLNSIDDTQLFQNYLASSKRGGIKTWCKKAWYKFKYNWNLFCDDKPRYQVRPVATRLGGDDKIKVKEGTSIIAEDLVEPKNPSIKAILPVISAPVTFPENSAQNLVNSVLERQAKCSREVDFDEFNDQLLDFTSYVNTLEFPSVETETKIGKWLKTRNWPQAKKILYDEKFDGLPCNEQQRQIFGKLELVLTTQDKSMRLIGASNSNVQCTNGPMIKDISDLLKEFTKDQDITIACGYTREEYGRIVMDQIELHGDGVHYMSGDFSKFDSTITPQIMEAERSVYHQIVPHLQQEVDEFINRNQKDFKGFAASIGLNVIAKIMSSRSSGDPNTTIGNSLTNYLIWKYIYHVSGIELYKTLVCGDDVLLMGSRGELIKLRDFISERRTFERFGMKLKFGILTDKYYLTEWLSGIFVAAEINYKKVVVHIPKPGRVLAKAGLTHKVWTDERQLCALKAEKCQSLADALWFLPDVRRKCLNFVSANPLSARAQARLDAKWTIKNGRKAYWSNDTLVDLSLRYQVTRDDIYKFTKQFDPRYSYNFVGVFAQQLLEVDVTEGVEYDDLDIHDNNDQMNDWSKEISVEHKSCKKHNHDLKGIIDFKMPEILDADLDGLFIPQ